MAEVTAGGHQYRTAKLTPMQQLHLARRLLPMLTGAGDLLTLLEAAPEGEDPALPALLASAGPFVEALAAQSDEEVEAIVNACLVVVVRLAPDGKTWAQVMPRRGMMMFDDIELMDLLTLVWTVVQENLLGFSPARREAGDGQLATPRLVRS